MIDNWYTKLLYILFASFNLYTVYAFTPELVQTLVRVLYMYVKEIHLYFRRSFSIICVILVICYYVFLKWKQDLRDSLQFITLQSSIKVNV